MNWNSSQFVYSELITLAGARNMGDILRHMDTRSPIQARHNFYM